MCEVNQVENVETEQTSELNWTEMQFITVIIIWHANDINDSIELKLKFNGI